MTPMISLSMRRWREPLVIIALAALAIALWPAFIASRGDTVEPLAGATAAPLPHDYEDRDALIAFWEGAVREHHTNDMLSPRELAGQYLQRYRERGDIDDVIRAQAMAQRSLAIMPRNIAAISELAAVNLTLHRFRAALTYADELQPYDPTAAPFLALRANLLMELGEYRAAAATLRRIGPADARNVAAETARARYFELTGNLRGARALLADAMSQADAHIDEPAQSRAWYHFRAGELAFNAGDVTAAIDDERAALTIFPTYNLALKDLAKFELAEHHEREALAAAVAGAQVTPFAETLGYEADAQAALGDRRAAAITREEIFAIERLGNAYHVNDRLLAVYYADHHLRANDALTIARREVGVRGDEIYAQDTLAWAAAMAGRWAEARAAAQRATRLGTEDPVLQYHAAIIALRTGHQAEGWARLRRALALNPQFHPVYADDARRRLAAK
jgi:Tfp pilus assembly protein PilF